MAVTENGWPGLPATADMLNWITVPGTNPPVKLQIQKGQPTQILRAFVADMNAYIEPVYDADCACYTRENSVFTSNHRSGTACDIRWNSHPFHVKGTFGNKLPALRELLAFYENTVFWGGDWTDPIDEMHFQMGYNTFNNPKTQDFIDRKIRADGFSTFKRGKVVADAVLTAKTSNVEKVLPYDHSQQRVAQEKFWDCGPASTQIVLQAAGVDMSEDELIRALGTTTDGTNTVEQALPILNQRTKGQFKAVWLPHDPPSGDEREALWRNVKNSIDAGFGCVLNFEVPSNNFPRGTRGSVSPSYRGAKIWHYVACMGYADDGPGGRHLWIADPGFQPFGYWMSLEQAATAIPPHAYAFATVKAPAPPQPAPAAPSPATQTPVNAPVRNAEPPQPHPGVVTPSGYYLAGESHLEGSLLVEEFFVEWSAITIGDVESIYRVVKAAAGKAADTSPAFQTRAKTVLTKVPRESLSLVLNKIQLVEPELLTALTGKP